jgi:hypothetical protein
MWKHRLAAFFSIPQRMVVYEYLLLFTASTNRAADICSFYLYHFCYCEVDSIYLVMLCNPFL